MVLAWAEFASICTELCGPSGHGRSQRLPGWVAGMRQVPGLRSFRRRVGPKRGSITKNSSKEAGLRGRPTEVGEFVRPWRAQEAGIVRKEAPEKRLASTDIGRLRPASVESSAVAANFATDRLHFGRSPSSFGLFWPCSGSSGRNSGRS